MMGRRRKKKKSRVSCVLNEKINVSFVENYPLLALFY